MSAEKMNPRVAQLELALLAIIDVEPFSGTSRLDVNDWADALHKAQSIARAALDEAPSVGGTP